MLRLWPRYGQRRSWNLRRPCEKVQRMLNRYSFKDDSPTNTFDDDDLLQQQKRNHKKYNQPQAKPQLVQSMIEQSEIWHKVEESTLFQHYLKQETKRTHRFDST